MSTLEAHKRTMKLVTKIAADRYGITPLPVEVVRFIKNREQVYAAGKAFGAAAGF
jgi:hypothetical protein